MVFFFFDELPNKMVLLHCCFVVSKKEYSIILVTLYDFNSYQAAKIKEPQINHQIILHPPEIEYPITNLKNGTLKNLFYHVFIGIQVYANSSTQLSTIIKEKKKRKKKPHYSTRPCDSDTSVSAEPSAFGKSKLRFANS